MNLVQEQVVSPAQQRWNEMRLQAGIQSDRALERKLGISSGQIWQWIVKGREPHLKTLRRLKQILGVSLDVIDETIVNWRDDTARSHTATTDS